MTFKRPENHRYSGETRSELPAGGYVVKIMDVAVAKWPSGDPCFDISIDIAEGDYKDFYANDYRAQTSDNKWWRGTFRITPPDDNAPEWQNNRFWDFICAVEDSNPGFRFSGEETDLTKAKFAKKVLGALFRREETRPNADGKTFWNTKMFRCLPAEKIRNGEFRIPKDKATTSGSATFTEVTVEDSESDDLPF
jgi:hypothetical protein